MPSFPWGSCQVLPCSSQGSPVAVLGRCPCGPTRLDPALCCPWAQTQERCFLPFPQPRKPAGKWGSGVCTSPTLCPKNTGRAVPAASREETSTNNCTTTTSSSFLWGAEQKQKLHLFSVWPVLFLEEPARPTVCAAIAIPSQLPEPGRVQQPEAAVP